MNSVLLIHNLFSKQKVCFIFTKVKELGLNKQVVYVVVKW